MVVVVTRQIFVDTLEDKDLLESLLKWSKTIGWRYGWKSNKHLEGSFGHWNHNLVTGDDRKNHEDVEPKLLALDAKYAASKELWLRIKSRFPGSRVIRAYANQHTYGVEGYPHVDSTRDDEYTSMIYLCDTWRNEWGGETLIWDKSEDMIEAAVTPAPGRILTFPGSRLHRATSVSRMCPVGRIVLVYKLAGLSALPKTFSLSLGPTKSPTPTIGPSTPTF